MVPRGVKGRGSEATEVAGKESESERIRREMGAIDKRGMLVEVDSVRQSSLRRAVTAFAELYHRERNHQGKENVLLFPAAEQRVGCRDGKWAARSDWAAY